MAYWLMKSEPGTYSWDRLVKDGRTAWDGVRNHQAAFNLKAMKRGDRAFFYHSGDAPAVVGIVEVIKASYPDPSDPAGRFVMVDLKPVKALAAPVPLSNIKANAALKDLPLLRQGRLSVVPIDAASWDLICRMGGL
jgi:predicted RNA-binding protein with PUA-like domain